MRGPWTGGRVGNNPRAPGLQPGRWEVTVTHLRLQERARGGRWACRQPVGVASGGCCGSSPRPGRLPRGAGTSASQLPAAPRLRRVRPPPAHGPEGAVAAAAAVAARRRGPLRPPAAVRPCSRCSGAARLQGACWRARSTGGARAGSLGARAGPRCSRVAAHGPLPRSASHQRGGILARRTPLPTSRVASRPRALLSRPRSARLRRRFRGDAELEAAVPARRTSAEPITGAAEALCLCSPDVPQAPAGTGQPAGAHWLGVQPRRSAEVPGPGQPSSAPCGPDSGRCL